MDKKPSTPILVSFSGIDGAGKSTQIELLRNAIGRAGLRQETITFWDDVVTLKNLRERSAHKAFNGDQGVGTPEKPISRRDKNVQSPLLTAARICFYLLDAISLRSAIRSARTKSAGAEVILFDRFIYDELANLSPPNPFTRLFIALVLRFVPKPDLAFVIDAEPAAAFARKPEYPVQFLRANRTAYLELAKSAGITVIPPSSPEQAHAEILRLLRQKSDALLPGVRAAGQSLDSTEFLA